MFYFKLSVQDLEQVIEAFRLEFETLLEDSFSDEELVIFEEKIESIAAIFVQPILSELSFGDFYEDPELAELQRTFFEACRSSLCLENLPFFETNPFQVSYLKLLLDRFDEVLIDPGGVRQLCFKKTYLKGLEQYKDIDSLLPKVPSVVIPKTTRPVDPIDFLILDVYKEVARLESLGKTLSELNPDDLSEKVQKIFRHLEESKSDTTKLLKQTGLNPKDFDDGLERLKFWLRKQ